MVRKCPFVLLSHAQPNSRTCFLNLSSRYNLFICHISSLLLWILSTSLAHSRTGTCNTSRTDDNAGGNTAMGSYQKTYRSMEPRLPSLPQYGPGNKSIGEHETTISRPTWRHLFTFTNRNHSALLVLTVLAAASAAAAKTTYAIFLGKAMDIVTRLGAEAIGKDEALAGVKNWCMVLAAVGAANWAANSLFMATWTLFGELMTRAARRELFANLLRQDQAWFDGQRQGVRSTLSRIQKYVHAFAGCLPGSGRIK